MLISPQATILYVEDDANCREIMKLLLCKVMKFPGLTLLEDNSNFMEKIQALPAVPTVIFLDIQMKPYDGYEMLKMLRTDHRYERVPIIAMTANVMASDVETLKVAGFDGMIAKPIVRQVFPELLKQILTGQPVWFIS